ncbi:TetR/AcrR family transcriptional regulator [Lactobacillus kunkeei]|uniref:TetR/AcrR family transcriptional regulator n=1 Tax=Apilactobacillus nanyangensis TaxID=2799579 RepID=A0ABT0HVN5_9LACO|nr:TetR/AcrR family transcriptional regulator [Apilactobacillus nanyangensis]MBC6389313.1 TetR/AcrR family transcriptional regulator [Apilactobacillus kunkeei]MCT6859296.1 TetR/AcrR family transcriptional regulator [Apilactobacillus sp.]MCK8610995.1 TetR/AcrR family transcriptional regulator [Apilactobacillus nanyangensis]TMS99837.1 TetR/AcrR family transcriptional regulator [Apilactobacillus kunkeei]TMT03187.1 TetR/AcrR family transcriptional regulator [Apilactobacillus kunkeei]
MNIKTADEKQRKQALIAETALKMFEENDFYDISINAIAQRSNVAKGTVFNYFKTKENIFMHLLLVGYQEFFLQTINQLIQAKLTTIPELKSFLLSNTRDLIENHLTLIKLNALRGPVLEGKASREETIEGRKKLYEVHEQLAELINSLCPSVDVKTANKIFIIQSSIASGLINLSNLDSFNQEPIPVNMDDFQISILNDSVETFDFYLTGLLGK